MKFPTSITFNRDIPISIKSQHFDEVLSIVEQNCLLHGSFDFTRENDKVMFKKLFFKGWRKKSSLFEHIDYGTAEIDVISHTIIFNFFLGRSAVIHLGVGMITIISAIVNDFTFSDLHLIVLGILVLSISISNIRLKHFVTNLTNEINFLFSRLEDTSFS